MAEQKFNYENKEDVSKVREHIASVLNGLDSNRLVFKTSKKMISLQPDSPLKIKIKVRKKGRDCKLSLQLFWKEAKSTEEDILITSD